MSRTRMCIRMSRDGTVEITDPALEDLPLLQSIDPDFRIKVENLPGFASPRFQDLRSRGCGYSHRQLLEMPEQQLWLIHDSLLSRQYADIASAGSNEKQASILDLKIELSRRILSSCRLCGHRCRVDRTTGSRGICGLGLSAAVAERFVHVAEEPPVNPSLLLELAGCGLRCKFCQKSLLLEPSPGFGEPLHQELWSRLDCHGARSLSFVGGNPDESLYAILLFLKHAPLQWQLPVVWNCHAYASQETVKLLHGIVDVYLPDFKFGSSECARLLSMAPDYPEQAKETLSAMVAQGIPVIIRILVMPGHFACCHAPALNFLSTLDREVISVSVRGQYFPEGDLGHFCDKMKRRPHQEEIEAVRQRAEALGLTVF